MKGVNIFPEIHEINWKHDRAFASVSRKSKSIMVRPSISRGRGYAVVLIREEIDESENIHIRPAPLTAKLARIGRFDSMPDSSAIADLPDPIMSYIFSYLDDAKTILRCSSVCKQWRQIISSIYVSNGDDAFNFQGPKIRKPLDTIKVKIFGNSKIACGIETSGQRKDENSFREVTVKLADTYRGSVQLLSYLRRLAAFLNPTKAFFLADIELDDAILRFLCDLWQPRVTEIRLWRCSFDGVTSTGANTILHSNRLRHLYVDNCSLSSKCPLASASVLFEICKTMTRLELCFCGNETFSSAIDDQFLHFLAESWKTKADIRWMKLCNAPKITTDGIEKLIELYFKLKYGSRRYDYDNKKGFIKTPNFVLWLCDTNCNADEFLKRRVGRRYFQDDKLPTSKRRKLCDNYGGDDVVIWLETSSSW